MKQYDVALSPIHYACVSGGKDSLYMFYHICNNIDKYPLDMVVHFKLEIDYPFISNVTNYIRRKCELLGIKYVEIKPSTSYYDLLEKWYAPSRLCRWCNSNYKMDCDKQLKKWIKEQNCRPVAYVGLCSDEVSRFKYTIGNIKEGQDLIYPLAEDDIEESTILEWAKNIDLFDDYYKLFKRCGCMFCPNSSYKELAYLYIKFPDKYKWWMDECKKSEDKYKSGVFQSNPKYNAYYIDERIKTKYAPKLLQEMKEKGIII